MTITIVCSLLTLSYLQNLSRMLFLKQFWVTFSFENLLLGHRPSCHKYTEESHLMQGLDSKDGV